MPVQHGSSGLCCPDEQSTHALQVRPWSHDVIAWLTQLQLSDVATSLSQGRCRQLDCFAAWVRLGAMFQAEPAQLDQLVELAFRCTMSQNEGQLCMDMPAALSVHAFYHFVKVSRN